MFGMYWYLFSLALHVLERLMQRRLTGRQNELYHYARENKYQYIPNINWNTEHFEKFRYFEYHLIDYQRNILSGRFSRDQSWTISDVTFNDGILMAREEHHITVIVVDIHDTKEDFIITKENIRQIKSHTRVQDEEDEGIEFQLDQLSDYLVNHASYYFECTEGDLLIYRKERLLSPSEIKSMHDFAMGLCKLIPELEFQKDP
jgi:hypothetical protein